MQIQVNSDNHIQGDARLQEWVRTVVEGAVEHYQEDLTRVEVHLADENGQKSGPDDMRCQMVARPKGHQPISVTHKAETLELAIDGAAEKLSHALEHLFGRLRNKRAANTQTIPDGPNEALLEEEFLENEQVLNSKS